MSRSTTPEVLQSYFEIFTLAACIEHIHRMTSRSLQGCPNGHRLSTQLNDEEREIFYYLSSAVAHLDMLLIIY